MGIYVQQQHFQESITFSGIWDNPITIICDILVNERLVTIHFPIISSAESTAGIIIADLPDWLDPIGSVTNKVIVVNDNTTDVAGRIRIASEGNSFPVTFGNVGLEIYPSTSNTSTFTGTGLGGFPRFDFTYILKNSR